MGSDPFSFLDARDAEGHWTCTINKKQRHPCINPEWVWARYVRPICRKNPRKGEDVKRECRFAKKRYVEYTKLIRTGPSRTGLHRLIAIRSIWISHYCGKNMRMRRETVVCIMHVVRKVVWTSSAALHNAPRSKDGRCAITWRQRQRFREIASALSRSFPRWMERSQSEFWIWFIFRVQKRWKSTVRRF